MKETTQRWQVRAALPRSGEPVRGGDEASAAVIKHRRFGTLITHCSTSVGSACTDLVELGCHVELTSMGRAVSRVGSILVLGYRSFGCYPCASSRRSGEVVSVPCGTCFAS